MRTAGSETVRTASDLVSAAAETLGRSIVRGDVLPGSALPVEQDLGATLGVSRIVVREAVKTLAGKNLVRSARRAGTIVTPMESWNLLDPQVIGWMLSEPHTRDTLMGALSELRAIIEPEAAALAAARASTKQVLAMFEHLDAMERAGSRLQDAVAADVAFHLAILDATGNILLKTFAPGFGLLLEARFGLVEANPEAFTRNLADHRRIIEAIRDRDPEAARQHARNLLAKSDADMRALRQAPAGATTD